MRAVRARPLLRTILDVLVLVSLLGMAGLALRQSGLLSTAPGHFVAIDGDSLRRDGEDFRLHGIDAPELHQDCKTGSGKTYACGRAARDALHDLVSGQKLDCRIKDVDRYGRRVVTCSAGEFSINAEMVRRGWAIAYLRHGIAYTEEERSAKAARHGLWQGRFEMPEDWRSRHRGEIFQGSMTPDDAVND